MPLLLNVPFAEKDIAKSKGARWNPELKKWIAPKKKYYSDFVDWISKDAFYSIICDHFYIIEGTRTCYKCHQSTRVIGFGIEDYYSIEPDEDEPNKHWINSSIDKELIRITSEVKPLPEPVSQYIQNTWNNRISHSRKTQRPYLSNRCDHCGALQGKFPLFCEVDSPFFIRTPADAAKLTLHKITTQYDLIVEELELGYCTTDFLIKKCAKMIDSGIQL